MGENCSNCSWNADGLCDRIGILVEDDDRCNKWETVKIATTLRSLNRCGNLSYHD